MYRIFSVDDHIVEPADVWTSRLPRAMVESGPRVVEEDGREYWQYEGRRAATMGLNAVAGKPREEWNLEPTRFSDMIPGCYDPRARAHDLLSTGVVASLGFPTLPRFGGMLFTHFKDKELAAACVGAWNDFVLDEWCPAGPPGLYVPMVICQAWDPTLAAAEITRCLDKGAKALCFVENPVPDKLPGFHGDFWDPVWSVCQEADLPVCLHVCSSGYVPQPDPEASFSLSISLGNMGGMMAMVNLLVSPVFRNFPALKVVFSEAGIGWVPSVLERADREMDRHQHWAKADRLLPSEIFARNIYVCMVEEPVGFTFRDAIGVDRILCETDYPHADTPWPDVQEAFDALFQGVPSDVVEAVTHHNAERLFDWRCAQLEPGPMSVEAPTLPEYNPFDPQTQQDPFPVYARLRDEAPVCFAPMLSLWALSRYDDIAAVLKDPATFSSEGPMRQLFARGLGEENPGRILIATDPPVHTVMRKLASHGFTPRVIRAWETRMRSIVDEFLDGLLDAIPGGPIDLVADLFYPLPIIVIGEILGIPIERMKDFGRWADAFVAGAQMIGDTEEIARASAEFSELMLEIVAERRRAPGDDLVSVLLARAGDLADPLTDDEIALFGKLALLGGHETTTNLLGNWMQVLLTHPDALSAVRSDPGLIGASIEEVLRYQSPIHMGFREVVTPVELHGVRLDAGALLGLLFASGNRDERKWGPDADTFRLDRRSGEHIAFGHGIHYCLGAALARVEVTVVGRALLDRFPHIEPAGEPVQTPGFFIRGFATLPARMRAA